jgi:glycine cleavage system aminomethyltransferase T
LEKGYRLWGQDLSIEHDPFEAGIGFAVRMSKAGFQGKAALERIRERGPSHRLSALVMDDPSAVVMGKEPVRGPDGEVVAYVTSASYGYSIGRGIAYAYLPVPLAEPGMVVGIEYFDVVLPAHVAAEPLWDPAGERLHR